MHIDLQLELKYQDDFIKVEVDEHSKFIFLEWLQAPDTDVYRSSLQLASAISKEHGCEYWLSDARRIPYLDFANQNWILKTMTPLLLASQLKKFARLSSKESLSLLDTHRIYDSILQVEGDKLTTELEYFSNKEAALEWLFSEYDREYPAGTY